MIPNNRKKYDILVVRINAKGELANSRPCNHCIQIMKDTGIRRVYYSNESGDIVCEKLDKMEMLHVCVSLRIQRFQVKKLADIVVVK